MPYIATLQDKTTLDFIVGNIEMSILADRWHHLRRLFDLSEHSMVVSAKNTDTDGWTKWEKFPSLLMDKGGLSPIIDVHRSILPNEIVIESDYPTYDENYQAARLIGEIIENKGFIPHYYYSGNKSIHISVYLDWSCIFESDDILNHQLSIRFSGSENVFKKQFILWLRALMISCWNTKAKNFDTDLIKSSHLIRSELSRNTKGYKTFLGYTYKDLSFIPKICNEENRIYPTCGAIVQSKPTDINYLLEEFIDSVDKRTKKEQLARKHTALNKYFNIEREEKLRDGVSLLMSDEFFALKDGSNRAMFILCNELKRVYGLDKARSLLYDWNGKLDTPIKEHDIEIRLKQKNYCLSDNYINEFIVDLGLVSK